VFNKNDVKSEEEALEWMRDFEAFQAALRREEEEEAETGAGGSGYMGSLLNSMSLVLEEFYNNLSVVGVSSMTGAGIDEFFEAVERKRDEFNRDYKPELERRRAERDQEKEERREKEVSRMMKDMGVEEKRRSAAGKRREEPETVSDAEAMSSDEEGGGGLVDPDEEEEYDEEAESGLKARYEQALREGAPDPGDASFAKYIASANLQR